MAIRRWGQRFWTRLLDFDSSLDAGLFGGARWLGERWSAYADRIDRMRVTGMRRVALDLVSDAGTFGTGIALLVVCWALPYPPSEQELYAGAQEYSVVFTDRNGRFLGRRGIRHNDAIPLDEIPEDVINAVLATEDERFYEHFGVDVLGTFRAMFENVKANDIVQGGSSITQQVAKNLFLTPEQTIDRKIKEAMLALWIEARLSKREILKLYLDRAYMGAGAFGVEAAAEFYFNKSVREVNLAEAAMLAGLFKAPSRFAPHHNLPAARERANTVLNRMLESGFITEGQLRVARLNPANLVESPAAYVPEHFLDWAFEEVKRVAAGRAHVLAVRTTLDLAKQKKADEALITTLKEVGSDRHIGDGALVSMEHDGAVRAMVGGKDYAESQFNRAVNAKRQPGSSWKPFVYLTAMKAGMTPETVIVDAPICLGGWCPHNYSRGYAGRVTLMTGLTKSINTIPVRLAQKVGRKNIAETAASVGIRTPLRLNLSMPLGTNEVTVLDMTASYSVFANGGIKVVPYAISEMRTQTGEVIYDHDRDEPPRERVVEAKYIELLNSMLGNVVVAGTGRRARLDFTPAAGKTGTTQAYRDAWFMGFTGELTTGVWMGNDDFTPTKRVTGGTFPAQTWHNYMAVAHSDAYAHPILGVPMFGTEKPVETEEEKRLRLVQIEEDRQKRDRRIELLNQLNRLFQRGMLGPVREALLRPPSGPGAASATLTAGRSPSDQPDGLVTR